MVKTYYEMVRRV